LGNKEAMIQKTMNAVLKALMKTTMNAVKTAGMIA
jgi:hypothetical protein